MQSDQLYDFKVGYDSKYYTMLQSDEFNRTDANEYWPSLLIQSQMWRKNYSNDSNNKKNKKQYQLPKEKTDFK